MVGDKAESTNKDSPMVFCLHNPFTLGNLMKIAGVVLGKIQGNNSFFSFLVLFKEKNVFFSRLKHYF